MGGCQGDRRYEVIFWEKGERLSRIGQYTALIWAWWHCISMEADGFWSLCFFLHMVMQRPRKVELAAWGRGGILWLNRRTKEWRVFCKEFLSVVCECWVRRGAKWGLMGYRGHQWAERDGKTGSSIWKASALAESLVGTRVKRNQKSRSEEDQKEGVVWRVGVAGKQLPGQSLEQVNSANTGIPGQVKLRVKAMIEKINKTLAEGSKERGMGI